MRCDLYVKFFFECFRLALWTDVVEQNQVQHSQQPFELGVLLRPQTDENRRQEVVVLPRCLRLADEIFLMHAVACDGIGPFLRRHRTDPDGVDFLYLLIVRLGKDGAVLAGYHPAAVVNGPLEQRVARMEVVLRLDVDDEPDGLTV